MAKDNLQGITIGGEDLADQLLKQDITETINSDKYFPKKKGRVKYMDHKEKNGEVTRETQANLNIINLEANMEKARSNYQKTIALLLTGQNMASSYIRSQTAAADAASILRNLWVSGLRKYIVRHSQIGGSYSYMMTREGTNLTPKQAYEIYKKTKGQHSVDDAQPDAEPKALITKRKTATSSTPPPETPNEDPAPRPSTLKIPTNINVNVTIRVLFGFERS